MKAAVAILGVLLAVLAIVLMVQTAEISRIGKAHDETLKELQETRKKLEDAQKKIEALEGAGQPAEEVPASP